LQLNGRSDHQSTLRIKVTALWFRKLKNKSEKVKKKLREKTMPKKEREKLQKI
jgi:hypothetical protein